MAYYWAVHRAPNQDLHRIATLYLDLFDATCKGDAAAVEVILIRVADTERLGIGVDVVDRGARRERPCDVIGPANKYERNSRPGRSRGSRYRR